ncbi:MAG: hypothetical protein JO258_07295 [Alphaproteobacteria bacterium]|nr:hypothetical protein [Alphaproteobacteria bacterium]
MLWTACSALLALLALAPPALADGTVLRASGCGDKLFVASERAYSVLRASEHNVAADGERLLGDLEHIGFGTFFVPHTGRRFSATVDERGLTKSEVDQRIVTACRGANAANQASGQVERAPGCGNKIFVNTAQGYAVLERLAGGLVYVGDTLSGDLNKAGRATVKDRQTGSELVVFVDDFALPRSAAARKIASTCR